MLDYGDGASDTFPLPAGTTSFYTEHHYSDKSPAGGFTIVARIEGAVEGTAAVTVVNTPPSVVIGPSSDVALNTAAAGFPTPLESDHGWGGGNQPWEIVDGKTSYAEWYHGLAFTGGNANWAGEPAGPRQATIDFGQNRTFDKVVLWHHGDDHLPQKTSLDFWNGSAWVPISLTRTLDIAPGSTGWSRSDAYTFAPVTGSRVRYSFDNRLQNILGTQITHGWLWEFEVWSKTSQITLNGSSLTYSGSFSDPGAHDTFTATVNYGDGTGDQALDFNPDRTFALSHNYASPGTFTVTVKVTDENKGVGTDTSQVVVPALERQSDVRQYRHDDAGDAGSAPTAPRATTSSTARPASPPTPRSRPAGQTSYTWTTSTTDPRALQVPRRLGPGRRLLVLGHQLHGRRQPHRRPGARPGAVLPRLGQHGPGRAGADQRRGHRRRAEHADGLVVPVGRLPGLRGQRAHRDHDHQTGRAQRRPQRPVPRPGSAADRDGTLPQAGHDDAGDAGSAPTAPRATTSSTARPACPAYATVTPTGQSTYTWTTTTTDPRALQDPGAASRGRRRLVLGHQLHGRRQPHRRPGARPGAVLPRLGQHGPRPSRCRSATRRPAPC